MKTAIAHLENTSPYSQSRHYKDDVPYLPKEGDDNYEVRTWRHRMHVNKAGQVTIPGPAFANCIKAAAKRLRIKVPGKGNSEYTQFFAAGIMCTDGLTLDVKAEEVPCDKLFLNSDGRVGGGRRVTRYMPRIDSWGGPVTFYIFDDIITEDIFRQVLISAGLTVGLGRFRPENRGFYGRFHVQKIEWSELDFSAAAAAE